MTVFQKVMNSNLDLMDFTDSRVKVSRSTKGIKDIINAAKLSFIVLGSMALSFFVMFLR